MFKCRVIILSNLYCWSLFAAVANFSESGLYVLVQCLMVKVGFYSPYLNKALQVVSFSSKARITSEKHAVHCTLKFCW
jgi:hypothetical protein